MKDILIIANFVSQIDGDGNSRFVYIANLLKEYSHVELISSSFSHTRKLYRDIKNIESNFDFDITLIPECGYSKNICLRRFYSHYCFGKNVFKYLQGRKKPDVIYCAVPSLTAAKLVGDYCKKENIKFIIDIQDLWPEAFKMVIKFPVISNIIFFPFTYFANSVYRSADTIIGVSRTYVDRARKVNQSANCLDVYLGTDLSYFDKNTSSVHIEKGDEIWLGYCGTLGTSYDLTCVFDALKILKDKGERVPRFIVMGNGPKEDVFKEYTKKLELDVSFMGLLPYPKMCAYLKVCDIVVNPIVANASQSIINKHADYAAAGVPVLNTQNSNEYRTLVIDYGMGINCNNGDAQDLAKNLSILSNHLLLRKRMGKQARKCAEEKFDRNNTYSQIVEMILNVNN